MQYLTLVPVSVNDETITFEEVHWNEERETEELSSWRRFVGAPGATAWEAVVKNNSAKTTAKNAEAALFRDTNRNFKLLFIKFPLLLYIIE